MKMPAYIYDEAEHQFEIFKEKATPEQTFTISIQKINIRGLEKFIKDLSLFVAKQCQFCDKLSSDFFSK